MHAYIHTYIYIYTHTHVSTWYMCIFAGCHPSSCSQPHRPGTMKAELAPCCGFPGCQRWGLEAGWPNSAWVQWFGRDISNGWLHRAFYKWGYPHSWMAFVRENPMKVWMMTGGCPISGKPLISSGGFRSLTTWRVAHPKMERGSGRPGTWLSLWPDFSTSSGEKSWVAVHER